MAAFIQRGIETALRRKLTYLARETGMTRLCLAGGLALNVVANGRLHDIFPDGVYVPCAPGDDGQSLGNVYALLRSVSSTPALTMRKSSDAYLGPAEHLGSARIAEALSSGGLARCVVYETADPPQEISAALARGSMVCVFGTRSRSSGRVRSEREASSLIPARDNS